MEICTQKNINNTNNKTNTNTAENNDNGVSELTKKPKQTKNK